MTKKYSLLTIFSIFLITMLVGCDTVVAPEVKEPVENQTSSTSTELSLNVTKNGTPYIGSTLAGTTAPLLNFTPEDYQKAQIDKKNIFLIFCNQNDTVCLIEMQNAISAFNQLDLPNLIGFSLKYNSPDSSAAESQIATQYQVAAEPTKIIINSKGEKIVQSTDDWNTEKYLEQLNQIK